MDHTTYTFARVAVLCSFSINDTTEVESMQQELGYELVRVRYACVLPTLAGTRLSPRSVVRSSVLNAAETCLATVSCLLCRLVVLR